MSNMKIIPYNRQYIDKNDLKEILKSSKSDIITTGNFTKKLEINIKKYFNVKYSICCNSGTSALFIALKSTDIKKGDIVIMPAINFVSAANICELLGAKIYLSDVDKITGQMTPSNLNDCIKKNKLEKIKIVLNMFLGGSPFNVKEFYDLKKKYKFKIIEDACHALGASYKHGKKSFLVGSCSHSDICIFSLHPTKSITSGEGGLVLTNNSKFFNNGTLARNHGMKKKFINKKISIDYDITMNSLNFRISDINAALAISQLKKLKKFVKIRNFLAKEYFKKLNLFEFYSLPKILNNIYPSWHLFSLSLNTKKIKKQKLIKYLFKNKIMTQIHYKPIYKFKVFRYLKNKNNFHGAEKYYSNTLSIPLHLLLNDEKINRISKKINDFCKK